MGRYDKVKRLHGRGMKVSLGTKAKLKLSRREQRRRKIAEARGCNHGGWDVKMIKRTRCRSDDLND